MRKNARGMCGNCGRPRGPASAHGHCGRCYRFKSRNGVLPPAGLFRDAPLSEPISVQIHLGLPRRLHAAAKCAAYDSGKTLTGWLRDVARKALEAA